MAVWAHNIFDPPPQSAEELYKMYLAKQVTRKNEDVEMLIKRTNWKIEHS